MFAATLLLASLAVAAPVKRDQPVGWATGYLEDYQTYHTRYLALSCQTQHDTTFFDDCCHPLLATETLDSNRPSYCNPSNASVSSASAYEATVSTAASADLEASSEYAEATSTVVSASASATEAASSSTSEAAAATSEVASAAGAWAEPSSAAASTTSTEEATSTSSSAAAASSTSSSSGEVYSDAYATFFYQNGVAGACGSVHSDSDYIIAIDTNGWWQDTSSASPYCGKSITLTNTNNGKSVTATVADACPTCDTNNSLDLSYAAFTAIASESDGQVPITWYWS